MKEDSHEKGLARALTDALDLLRGVKACLRAEPALAGSKAWQEVIDDIKGVITSGERAIKGS